MPTLPPGVAAPVPPAGQLTAFDSVDEATDEFFRRLDAGEEIDAAEFCALYPARQHSLLRAIQADLLLEEHPELLAAAAVHWPEPGESFLDKWVLEEELGRGGFARVYLARQPALGNRQVVLKLAPGGSGEAWTLGRLKHPHVVPILDIEEAKGAGLTAVCLPYLGRATLADLMDRLLLDRVVPERAAVILEAVRRPDEPPDGEPARVLTEGDYAAGVLHLAEEMAEALAYLHAKGVAHRDLKPSNVLLTPAGKAVLLDFNLAHDHAGHRRPIGGTPAYMAPEELAALPTAAAPDFSPAPDIYSFGVLLYEMLAGRHPFGTIPLRRSELERRDYVRRRQLQGAEPLTKVNPRVPAALAGVVERCMAYDPAQRYATAEELLAALRTCRPPSRRSLWASLAISAALAAFAAAMAAAPYWPASSPPNRPVDNAESGKMAFKEGDYDRAAEHFLKAIEENPDSAELKLAMGRTQQRRNNLDSALEYLKKARKKDDSPRIQAAYAYCHAESGQYDSAIEIGTKARDGWKDNPKVWHNLAFCHLQKRLPEEVAEARSCLDQALKLDPKLAIAYHVRALCDEAKAEEERRNKKKYVPQQGIADVREAIRLGYKDPRLYYHGAYLCGQANKAGVGDFNKEGLAWLEQALDGGYPWSKVVNQKVIEDYVKALKEKETNPEKKWPDRDVPKNVLIDPLND